MNNFTIDGASLIVTKNGIIVFSSPKRDFWFRNDNLNNGELQLFDLNGTNEVNGESFSCLISDAQINGEQATAENVRTFQSENLGKTNAPGNGASIFEELTDVNSSIIADEENDFYIKTATGYEPIKLNGDVEGNIRDDGFVVNYNNIGDINLSNWTSPPSHQQGWPSASVSDPSITDSRGVKMYTLTDSSTASGTLGWRAKSVSLNTFIPLNTDKVIVLEVLKSPQHPTCFLITTTPNLPYTSSLRFEMNTDNTISGLSDVNSILSAGEVITIEDKGATMLIRVPINRGTGSIVEFTCLVSLRDVDDGGAVSTTTGSTTISHLTVEDVVSLGDGLVHSQNKSHIKELSTTQRTGDVAFMVVGGQSNAEGHTDSAGEAPSSCPNVRVIGQGQSVWKNYSNSDNNRYRNNRAGTRNPLTAIADNWQNRIDSGEDLPDLYILNVSLSGSGFYDDGGTTQWNPFLLKNGVPTHLHPIDGNSGTEYSLFYTLQSAIKSAVYEIVKSGKRPLHYGTIWNQWETEALTVESATAHPQNLQLVRSMIDKALNIENATFYAWYPVSLSSSYESNLSQIQSNFDDFFNSQENTHKIDAKLAPNFTGLGTSGSGDQMGIFISDGKHYDVATQNYAAEFVVSESITHKRNRAASIDIELLNDIKGYDYQGTGYYNNPSVPDETSLLAGVWTKVNNLAASSSTGTTFTNPAIVSMFNQSTQRFTFNQFRSHDIITFEIAYKASLDVSESVHLFRLLCTENDDNGNSTFTKNVVGHVIKSADDPRSNTLTIDFRVGNGSMLGDGAFAEIEAFCDEDATIILKHYSESIK